MNIFGKELNLLRKEQGVSQDYLAKETNCSKSYISRLESGQRSPNEEIIKQFTSILADNDFYILNKLLLLAGFYPEVKNDRESLKIVLKLALELKKLGLTKEARQLTEIGLKLFEKMPELYALYANLYLIDEDFDLAITTNENALSAYDKLSEKEQKDSCITKAEIIHNLGNVYFERALKENKKRDALIIQSISSPFEGEDKGEGKNSPIPNSQPLILKIEQLRKEIIKDLNIAIEKIEESLTLEPEHSHIIDQLARALFNRANLEITKNNALKLWNKCINAYDCVIRLSSKELPLSKKLQACVFLPFAYAKMGDFTEALRLIHILIITKPEYYLGYYARACIYAISFKGQNVIPPDKCHHGKLHQKPDECHPELVSGSLTSASDSDSPAPHISSPNSPSPARGEGWGEVGVGEDKGEGDKSLIPLIHSDIKKAIELNPKVKEMIKNDIDLIHIHKYIKCFLEEEA